MCKNGDPGPVAAIWAVLEFSWDKDGAGQLRLKQLCIQETLQDQIHAACQQGCINSEWNPTFRDQEQA